MCLGQSTSDAPPLCLGLTCQLLSAAAAGSRVRSEVEEDLARISAELSSDLARISAELGLRGGVGAGGVDAGEPPAYTPSGTYADVC